MWYNKLIMNNSESKFYLGYVEQGIGGSQDPLNPPISISRNGTLAKWRDKMNFIDIRVNDPGLKKHRAEFELLLTKLNELNIEPILTLPEFIAKEYKTPPKMSEEKEKARFQKLLAGQKSSNEDKKIRREKPLGRDFFADRPEKFVHFRPCYLAVPDALRGNKNYSTLAVEDCLPIIELGAKFGVKKIIVPVSEPGMFIDPLAEVKFKKALKVINEAAKKSNMEILIRNGGISMSVFKKLAKEFGCKMAYDLGYALLECDDIEETYRNNSEYISCIIFQQLYSGLGNWTKRHEDMESALANMLKAEKDLKADVHEDEVEYIRNVCVRYNEAYIDYEKANLNGISNLGLFQSGDLNFVPLLKIIRGEIKQGKEKYLLIETVPNTKNNDLLLRGVMPDNFANYI